MANVLLRSLQVLEATNEPTARWTVPLNDGNHVIEFEHGTATGRRVVRIDNKVLINRDWMFRLVGDEIFTYGHNKFVIRIDPIAGLKYSYTLLVNGRSLKSFVKSQSKVLKSWLTKIGEDEYRIVIDKQSQNVWINGIQVDVENEFIDGGAKMLFFVAKSPAVIKCCSAEKKDIGIDYFLYIDNQEVKDDGGIAPAMSEV